MAAALQLTRETIGVDVRRGMSDVVVDGNPAGSVELNETVEIPVERGRHAVQVRNDRRGPSESLR